LTYARWGVDYLKYDWCNTEKLNPEGAYLNMSRALQAAKRPVVLSICEWGDNEPWKWGAGVGHLWRTSGDITNCFNCVEGHGNWKSRGILQVIDAQTELRAHAGPDHWNDPDMLEVGNGMTTGEDRAHFSLWAMMAAPLIAGNDLSTMSQTTRAILTNSEVIAVDQDPLGIQGFVYLEREDLQVWAKPLARGGLALAFLNRGRTPEVLDFSWKERHLKDDLTKHEFRFAEHTYRIRDLWARRDLGTTQTRLKATVPGHDVMVVRLDPMGNAPRR
jgi:alpha-galactosidase